MGKNKFKFAHQASRYRNQGPASGDQEAGDKIVAEARPERPVVENASPEKGSFKYITADSIWSITIGGVLIVFLIILVFYQNQITLFDDLVGFFWDENGQTNEPKIEEIEAIEAKDEAVPIEIAE